MANGLCVDLLYYDSLREVIPFPKTARAVDLMTDAPTPVPDNQLRDLGIALRKQDKK